MTNGFVLIFVGIQLNLVHSYELTPRITNFLASHSDVPANAVSDSNQAINSTYYQASFPNANYNQPVNLAGPPKVVTTPPWLCWPVLFLGAIVFLHGFSKRKE